MGKFVKMPLELLKPRVEFDPAGKTPKPVPQSVLLTYSWIAKHRDHNTGEAYPSVRLLAELSGLSRRTVQRSIRMLERLGFISVEINNPKGRRQSVNLYRLNGVTPVSRGASPMAQGCVIDDRTSCWVMGIACQRGRRWMRWTGSGGGRSRTYRRKTSRICVRSMQRKISRVSAGIGSGRCRAN